MDNNDNMSIREPETMVKANAEAPYRDIFLALPQAYAILSAPDHRVVAATDAYCAIGDRRREELTGKLITEVLPDNSGRHRTQSSRLLMASLRAVLRTGKSHSMGIVRYDIPADGGFEERWWRITHTPVISPSGKMTHIIHQVEDIHDILNKLEELEVTAQANAGQWVRPHASN